MAIDTVKESLNESSGYLVPDSFERFLADLKGAAREDRHPLINPKLFASALSIDIQTLASQAHVHRTTISRAQGQKNFNVIFVMHFVCSVQRRILMVTFMTLCFGFATSRLAHLTIKHPSNS